MVQQFDLYWVKLKWSHCSQVFSRRDQLALRATKKEKNKDRKAKGKEAEEKNDAGKKGKGKRRGATGKSTNELDGQDGESPAVATETQSKDKRRKPTKRSKLQKMKAASASAASSPASAPKADRSNKRKQKPARDANNANVEPKTRKQKRLVTEVCDKDVKNFLVQQEQIVQWVNQNIDLTADFDTYKKAVNAIKSKFAFFRHNIYWTKNTCGLTMKDPQLGTINICHFSFNDKSRRAGAVSIACAEHVVAQPN